MSGRIIVPIDDMIARLKSLLDQAEVNPFKQIPYAHDILKAIVRSILDREADPLATIATAYTGGTPVYHTTLLEVVRIEASLRELIWLGNKDEVTLIDIPLERSVLVIEYQPASYTSHQSGSTLRGFELYIETCRENGYPIPYPVDRMLEEYRRQARL